MSDAVVRPRFFEGQVLAAADLGASVEYARQHDALHERTEHTWGIAQGLTFREVSQTAGSEPYKDLYLQPGMAVDVKGHRIVVEQEQLLRYTDFREQGVFSRADIKDPAKAATEAIYPVYLVPKDEDEIGRRGLGACATSQASRTRETFTIEFGRPGSEAQVLRGESKYPKVLLGYVGWKDKVPGGGRFHMVAYSADTGAVRYAGVRASHVVGHTGSVLVQTRPEGTHFAVAVTETSEGGCELRFGRREGDGDIAPAFKVNEKGDIEFTGTLNRPGLDDRKVLAESGVISHGLRVPLPAGVDEAAVEAGAVRLHIVVTPRHGKRTVGSGGSAKIQVAVPMACEVDVERRVKCLVAWTGLKAWDVSDEEPFFCDYYIIATTK